MKKTVCIILTLSLMLTVFFCTYVNGATYTGSAAVHKNASGSSQGVTYEINLDQYYPVQNADSGNVAGEVYTTVYYRITNSNDQSAYVRNTGFIIQWVTAPYIVKYETVSENLLLGYQNTGGSWYIYGDSPYSYSSGIVVAPHSSLYCVAYIVTSASVIGNTVSSQTISSVSLANHTITLGDYPYGNGASNLAEIENLVEDIKSQLIFTGTITPVTNATVVQKSFQFLDMGATLPQGVNGYISLKRLSGFAMSEAVATALGSYAYHSTTYVRPYLVNIVVNNSTDHAISSNLPYLNFQNIFDKVARPSIVSYGLDSSLLGTPNILMDTGDYLTLQVPIKYSFDGVTYIPKGNHVVTFYLLFIFEEVNTSYSYNVDVTMNNIFSTSTIDLSYNNESAILDMQYKVNEIYNYMYSSNSSNISSDSQTIHDQSSAIHNQEATYYAQNSQAIEATGLSNYQFDNTTVSGLQGVRGDFIAVWNALSGWNSVYIFSLTLGLALTILRHSPSAISSAINRRRYKNNGGNSS